MPKIVDHSQRREQIADVAIDLLSERGLKGTTVRAVVAAAGLSSGAIRHYFTDHESLLRYAGEHLTERLRSRIRSLQFPEGLSAVDRACALAQELLPLDRRRRGELIAYVELASMDRGSGYWSDYRRMQHRNLRHLAHICVGLLTPKGTAVGEETRERLARRVHWCIDGLSAQEVIYPEAVPPQEMTRFLREVMEDVSAELHR